MAAERFADENVDVEATAGGEPEPLDALDPPEREHQEFAGAIFGVELLALGDRGLAAEDAFNVDRRAAMVRLACSGDVAACAGTGGEVFVAEPIDFVMPAALSRPGEI